MCELFENIGIYFIVGFFIKVEVLDDDNFVFRNVYKMYVNWGNIKVRKRYVRVKEKRYFFIIVDILIS